MSKFLTGAFIGVVVGLLIAPEKGEDLRTDIADTAEKWKTKLDRLRGKANANLDDLRGLLESEIDGLSDDLKSRILTILDDANDMAYQAKSVI
ncbi:MAG: YtxH domain-containing protein [Sphingobacteriales bacterium]|nr:MAG: YtxH domain-containing protein [Sphingobacteriales bacterium]